MDVPTPRQQRSLQRTPGWKRAGQVYGRAASMLVEAMSDVMPNRPGAVATSQSTTEESTHDGSSKSFTGKDLPLRSSFSMAQEEWPEESDSFTIEISSIESPSAEEHSEWEEEYEPREDGAELTVELLESENKRLRQKQIELREALKTRDAVIKKMKSDHKKYDAIHKRHKVMIMDMNKELAEVHKAMLTLKSDKIIFKAS